MTPRIAPPRRPPPVHDDARGSGGRQSNTGHRTTARIIPLPARRRNCHHCGIPTHGDICDPCAAWIAGGDAIALAAAALRRAHR